MIAVLRFCRSTFSFCSCASARGGACAGACGEGIAEWRWWRPRAPWQVVHPPTPPSNCKVAKDTGAKGKRCRGGVVRGKVNCPKGCVMTAVKCYSSSSKFGCSGTEDDTTAGDVNTGWCMYRNQRFQCITPTLYATATCQRPCKGDDGCTTVTDDGTGRTTWCWGGGGTYPDNTANCPDG